jgi:hypothetical protein
MVIEFVAFKRDGHDLADVPGATPLYPAGHLPLKGGDRLVVTPRPSRTSRLERRQHAQPISPLEGEMPGRAEGGSRTHQTLTSSTRFGIPPFGRPTP